MNETAKKLEIDLTNASHWFLLYGFTRNPEKYVLLDLRDIITYIFFKITSNNSEALPVKFCLQNLFKCKRMGT